MRAQSFRMAGLRHASDTRHPNEPPSYRCKHCGEHLEVRDVAHEELPERNVPAVQLERLLGIALVSFEVRGKTFRGKLPLNPREDIRAVDAGAFRLMVALLVSQENSYRYKSSPGDLNQRSFPGPLPYSIPTVN